MKNSFAAIVLCVLAAIKVVADVFGFERLGAAAAVTNAAPAMKVFTAQKGYETYSSTFEISILDTAGQTQTMRLSPGNYSGLQGPYNRRNVYGALIAYGPVLVSDSRTEPMWEEMARRAFCRQPNVMAELMGKDVQIASATIDYLRQVQTDRNYPRQLTVSCE